MKLNLIKKVYSVRFNQPDMVKIVILAKKHKVTVSEWLRNAALKWRPGKVD
jgi:hypothetical protein